MKTTITQMFLKQMEQIAPWAALIELIAPYYLEGKAGRPPFSRQTMLRVHFMPQWFKVSDPGMEEAFFDTPLYREFARPPGESTILRLRHLLEKHKLAKQILGVFKDILIQPGLRFKTGTVVDATLIAAPSSTKRENHKRNPEMHSSKKGQQMYSGMKAHFGADPDSDLVHTVRGTSGNVSDVVDGNSLLLGEEIVAFGNGGYQGIQKRPDAKADVTWHVAMRAGKRRVLNLKTPLDALTHRAENCKASIRAKVEHLFRMVKRQFGFLKVRYRGLKKKTAQMFTLFALSNLWMVRGKLMEAQA